MTFSRRPSFAPLVLTVLLATVCEASAQPTRPATPAPLQGPATADTADETPSTDDPKDGEPFEAAVSAYLLSPEADVAGLLFDNGREIRVPPNVGRGLADLVKPGDSVQVGPRPRLAAVGPPHGWPSIKSMTTGRTVSPDEPPPGSEAPATPPSDRRANLAFMHVTGAVDRKLHGPRGETNGVRLTSGVQVSFPPRVAVQLGARLSTGQSIDVQGYGRTSQFGTAIQATLIAAAGGPPVQVYDRPGSP